MSHIQTQIMYQGNGMHSKQINFVLDELHERINNLELSNTKNKEKIIDLEHKLQKLIDIKIVFEQRCLGMKPDPSLMPKH